MFEHSHHGSAIVRESAFLRELGACSSHLDLHVFFERGRKHTLLVSLVGVFGELNLADFVLLERGQHLSQSDNPVFVFCSVYVHFSVHQKQ